MLWTLFIFCLIVALVCLAIMLAYGTDETISAIQSVALISAARTLVLVAAFAALLQTLIKTGVIARLVQG